MVAYRLARILRRRWLLAASLVFLVLLGVGALVSGPLALHFLKRRALAHGLDLSASRAKVGFVSLTLTNVRLRRTQPTLDAQLGEVEFTLGLTGTLQAVRISNGTLLARSELSAWRRLFATSSQPERVASGNKPSHRTLSLRNLKLRWQPAGDNYLELAGLSLEQTLPGKYAILSQSATLAYGGLNAQLTDLHADVDLAEGARRLSNLNIETLSAQLVSTAKTTNPPNTVTPPPPTTATANPPDTAPGTAPNTSEKAALSRTLRSHLDALLARTTPFLSQNFRFKLEQFTLGVKLGSQTFSIGPERVTATREPTRFKLQAEPKTGLLPGSTPLSLALTLPFNRAEPLEISLVGGPITLRELGIKPGDLGLQQPELCTLEASTQILLGADGARVSFSGGGSLTHLSLHHPKLSTEPIQDLQLGVKARGEWDDTTGLLTLADSELTFGEVHIVAKGSLANTPTHLAIHGTLEVPLAACQAAKNSLPRGLFPLLSEVALSGTFAFSARVDADSKVPSKTLVSWVLNNECHVDSITSELNPARFAQPFTLQVVGSRKEALFLETGPGAASWTPASEIAPAVIAAVLVSEDGNFYGHHGFDFRALQMAVKDNLNAGKFLRGGSTVSMQLAKNLYLKREKTLARKLQEAFFTVLLEQELSKEQIMTLYLNVIEYGPDIYGLRQAAQYYFATEPSKLSLAQAFFLVSILPNPKEPHFTAEGLLKPRWNAYLNTLLRIAHERKRISAAELTLGLTEELHFGEASTLPRIGSQAPAP